MVLNMIGGSESALKSIIEQKEKSEAI